jgi:hypothetical protein
LKEFIMSEQKGERKKEKSRGFADFGIPVGSVLTFKKDPAITVKTTDDKNRVEYQGKSYSVSTLAKELVGSPVSGYLYFKFGDRVLKSLGKSEAEESPKPVTTASADEGQGVPMEAGEAEVPAESGGVIDPLAGGFEVDAAASSPADAE